MITMRISSIFMMLMVLVACQSTGDGVTGPCGSVSVFQVPPETQDLYRAQIDRIDDRNVVGKGVFSLEPGSHTFKVYEQIDDPRLGVPGGDRGYSKQFTVDVEEGKRYHLAAKFILDKRFSKKNEYWEPVIWKVTDEGCH